MKFARNSKIKKRREKEKIEKRKEKRRCGVFVTIRNTGTLQIFTHFAKRNTQIAKRKSQSANRKIANEKNCQ